MSKHCFRRGFTLIELLVVVAIIALLISILVPALQGARHEGKKAKCLSNFRSVAQASVAYASEDRKEQIIPIQQNTTSAYARDGFPNDGWLRLGHPFCFGGRTATIPYIADGGSQVKEWMKDDGRWAARTRPLNRYILGNTGIASSDSKNIEWFKCPGDTGYPRHNKATIVECPEESRERPLYDMLGNSYRANFMGWFFTSYVGSYSTAAWGHRVSTLQQTGRMALYSEALFYAMSFPGNNLDPTARIKGWHGVFMSDNVAYADGSARFTKCGKLTLFDNAVLTKMNVDLNVGDQTYVLRRGQTWQMDGYPTAAACIPWRSKSGVDSCPRPGQSGFPGDAKKWPYVGYQDNLRPD